MTNRKNRKAGRKLVKRRHSVPSQMLALPANEGNFRKNRTKKLKITVMLSCIVIPAKTDETNPISAPPLGAQTTLTPSPRSHRINPNSFPASPRPWPGRRRTRTKRRPDDVSPEFSASERK
jgi:hypothetical protein